MTLIESASARLGRLLAYPSFVRFLSARLGVPVSDVVLERGHGVRRKLVSVRGVTAASVRGLVDR